MHFNCNNIYTVAAFTKSRFPCCHKSPAFAISPRTQDVLGTSEADRTQKLNRSIKGEKPFEFFSNRSVYIWNHHTSCNPIELLLHWFPHSYKTWRHCCSDFWYSVGVGKLVGVSKWALGNVAILKLSWLVFLLLFCFNREKRVQKGDQDFLELLGVLEMQWVCNWLSFFNMIQEIVS